MTAPVYVYKTHDWFIFTQIIHEDQIKELEQTNEDSVQSQEAIEVVKDSTHILVTVEIPQVDAET